MKNKTHLKVGVGKARITPPVGIPFLGHGYRVSEGIQDDLWAKTLVLEGSGNTVIIVALDLCWPMPEGDYVKIRDAVQAATGIEGTNVMVSCTHSHQGPAFEARPEYPLAMKRQRELIDPWVARLPEMVAQAARDGAANMTEAAVCFGRTPMTGISYNRRKRIPEGALSLMCDTDDMPGYIETQYVERLRLKPTQAADCAPLGIPDGPIDPDLDVITFKDGEDKPIAVLVNFACHAVSCSPPVPNLISAGFPGFCCDLVEQETGAICLYTAGAGGDIRSYRSSARGFEEPRRIGLVLASGVLKAMADAEPIDPAALKAASEIVKVDPREYVPPEQAEKVLAEKKKLLEEAGAAGNVREARRLFDEIRDLDFAAGFGQWIGQKGRIPLEIQAISIGDIVLLALPNEVNVSVGLAIKKAAWTKKLLLATLTNGCYMYLLMKTEYQEGGYEVTACRLAPGSGEKVIAAASALIDKMR